MAAASASLAPANPALDALRRLGPDRAVGWIGLDVPLELIDAAGLVPLQVTADPIAPSPAAEPFGEGVGHPLLRALAGAVLELADAGLKRLMIAATPAHDFSLFAFLASLQRAGAGLAGVELVAVDMLHGDSPADRTHNRALFVGLQARLGGGEGLAAAVARRNAVREALTRLETRRRDGALTGAEVLALHAEGAVSPAEVFLAAIEVRLAETEGRPSRPGRRVVVSGSAETAARLYPALEREGLLVVGDDHDGGSRAIGPLVQTSAPDLLGALAERYRTRTPAPSGWPTAETTTALVQLARRQGAGAVVFDIPPQDHPAAWDFPAKRAALEAAGLAWMLLAPDAWRGGEATARAAAAALNGSAAHV